MPVERRKMEEEKAGVGEEMKGRMGQPKSNACNTGQSARTKMH